MWGVGVWSDEESWDGRLSHSGERWQEKQEKRGSGYAPQARSVPRLRLLDSSARFILLFYAKHSCRMRS